MGMKTSLGIVPVAVLALGVALTTPGIGRADPVTYTEVATASGSFNGVPFTNATITLTGTADTVAVTRQAATFSVNVVANVAVAGDGSGAFTDLMRVFANQSSTVAGFSDVTLGQDVL